MKTGNHAGVVLVSYYDSVDTEEVLRGTVIHVPSETLVEVPAEQAFTLSRLPAAPVDSPRKLWALGDLLKVGQGMKRRLPVFHGLYVHAGPKDRIGAYYSNVGNQVMFLEEADAEEQAKREGVIFCKVDALNPSDFATIPAEEAA
jgi:hypothetical protein